MSTNVLLNLLKDLRKRDARRRRFGTSKMHLSPQVA